MDMKEIKMDVKEIKIEKKPKKKLKLKIEIDKNDQIARENLIIKMCWEQKCFYSILLKSVTIFQKAC